MQVMFQTINSLRRLKIRSSSPSTSSNTSINQFLQQRSVSRTPKGKAKIKAGQPLRRQKITRKKPGAQAEAKSPRKSELEQLAEDCLNAPPTLRHLTPKQRAREDEREKLGLISKERQTEIKMMKEREKKGDDPPPLMGTPGLDFLSLGLVDADAVPKYELTAEDGKRLAKEYSRVLMRKHRARQAAETTLLRLKKEAIEALPDHLKEAALVPDLTLFPINRFMATLTPPIEGYVDKITEAASKSLGQEKIR